MEVGARAAREQRARARRRDDVGVRAHGAERDADGSGQHARIAEATRRGADDEVGAVAMARVDAAEGADEEHIPGRIERRQLGQGGAQLWREAGGGADVVLKDEKRLAALNAALPGGAMREEAADHAARHQRAAEWRHVCEELLGGKQRAWLGLGLQLALAWAQGLAQGVRFDIVSRSPSTAGAHSKGTPASCSRDETEERRCVCRGRLMTSAAGRAAVAAVAGRAATAAAAAPPRRGLFCIASSSSADVTSSSPCEWQRSK